MHTVCCCFNDIWFSFSYACDFLYLLSLFLKAHYKKSSRLLGAKIEHDKVPKLVENMRICRRSLEDDDFVRQKMTKHKDKM